MAEVQPEPPLLALIPASLRPYAKFIAPAFFALVGAIVLGVARGQFDQPQLEVLAVGFLSATLAFIITNGEHGIGRYAKALGPALLTVAGVGIHWLVTGQWNQAEWIAAITGIGTAFFTLLVPNFGSIVVLKPTDPAVAPGPRGYA